MRYRDAAHVDMGSFYAREPHFGKMYRVLGYFAVVIALWFANDPEILGRLLVALLVAWLMAWFRVVGALWRSSIVAATLLCAVLITIDRLQPALRPGLPGAVPAAQAAPVSTTGQGAAP